MSDTERVVCTACCAESSAEQRYCGGCGIELRHHAVAAVDEIRTATVLFADVADFTRLSAALGLEPIKALMDTVFERLYRVVVEQGGVVDKYIGDCVMALFGAPIAYGDDAARAVRAGLAFHRVLLDMRDDLAAQGLPPVQMRVGVSTGPVIAGPVGAGPQRRYTVMGHTVNIAAHLQQDAPLGAVVIGEGTHRRVRGLFEMQPLIGLEAPAYHVLAEKFGGLWLKRREVLGADLEMVGRDLELRRLRQLMQSCTERRESHMIIVEGAPGLGKTRLGIEFLAGLEARMRGLVRVVGFADPRLTETPFAVAADALRRKLELRKDVDAESLLMDLRLFLQKLGCGAVPGDEAILARMLGVMLEESVAHAHFSERVGELLASIVERITELAPMVIVVEDLQWCDPASLRLLDQIMRRMAKQPLMVVGFARPEFLREHPRLLEGPRRYRVVLSALDQASVKHLLARALGDEVVDPLLPLIASAAGNPFHIEELLRSLEERGVLARQVDGWRLSSLPDGLEIPPGVEALTQVRIDNLPREQRALLRDAAAVGNSFWEGALQALRGPIAAGDLSALVRRELVVLRQDSRYPRQREYRFQHRLTRDVAYSMIPKSQRASLHRRVARWLMEQQADAAEELALIAHHFELGGETERALEFFERAGQRASGSAAYSAAIAHFGGAIALCRDARRRFDLLARRERLLNAVGRWAAQQEDAEAMIALSGDDEGRRLEALLRSGRARLNLGELSGALQAFEEAKQLAERLGDREGKARALRWLGMYHFNRAEHLQALPLFTEALAFAESGEIAGLAAELAYELGVTVGTVGDYARAVDVSRRALQMFRQQDNRYQEAFCLGNLGCFHIYLGEHERAVELLREAAELGRRIGIPLAEASAEANLGNAYRHLGQAALTMELEARAGEVARRIGDHRLDADTRLYASLAARELDDHGPVAAEVLAREALELARAGDMAGTEAAALMALAAALEDQERIDEAVTRSTRALRILETLGTVEGFEAEIRLVHARLCRRVGRAEDARTTVYRAKEDLMRKAKSIDAADRRRRFLGQPVHRSIIELAGSLS